jgi:hypothetical protein
LYLRTCVPLPQFFYQLATASSWVTRIEHEEDDVGLVEDFVQYADVVSALLFLRLVGSCRRRVGRADEMSLAGADSANWAIEESVGSEAIIASSFRGACGGD